MSTERPYAPRENPDEAEVYEYDVFVTDLGGEEELNFDEEFTRDSLYEREDDFGPDDEGFFDDEELL